MPRARPGLTNNARTPSTSAAQSTVTDTGGRLRVAATHLRDHLPPPEPEAAMAQAVQLLAEGVERFDVEPPPVGASGDDVHDHRVDEPAPLVGADFRARELLPSAGGEVLLA